MLCPVEWNLLCFIFSPCRISLNTMTLQVESPTVYTSQGVPISVTGIAQVRDIYIYIYKTHCCQWWLLKLWLWLEPFCLCIIMKTVGRYATEVFVLQGFFRAQQSFCLFFLLDDVKSCLYNFHVSCLKLGNMFWWLFEMCFHVGGVVALKDIGTNFVAVCWPSIKSHFVCHIWTMLNFVLAVKEGT